MARSVAQAVTVSIGGDQEIEILEPVESHSTAQAVTVTLGTAQIVVIVNPAQRLPQT